MSDASGKPLDVNAVLLYYCYVDLSNAQEQIEAWYRVECQSLGLVGRVRVADDGINGEDRLSYYFKIYSYFFYSA